MPMQLPIMGGAYTGRSSNVFSQQCVNLFYEKGADGECLVGTPGASLFNGESSGEVRGGVAYNNLAYFVIGNTLYEFNSSGTRTSRGTLNSSSGRVSMVGGQSSTTATVKEIFIADGADWYIYDAINQSLALATDTIDAEIAGYIDGYFVFTRPNTESFALTGLYDGNTLDSTFNATGGPDNVVSLVVEQRQVFVMCETFTSLWYNSGDADSILQRFQGGYTQTGCVAPHSAVRFDNSVVWLSRNERGEALVVRSGEGFQPSVISTPEINYQFSTYSTVADAFAYAYQSEGHEFYVITFPTAKKTWAYDASTQVWHERAHTINGALSRERYNCHVFVFGKHLFGDFENGNIYEMDSDLGTINGDRMERIRVTSNISNMESEIRFSSVQLDMEEGIGDPNSDTDTRMYLSYSKDGGHTFGNEIEKDMGNAGEYARRVIWRRLGSARNWVFRFRTWSPRRIIIKGLIGRMYGDPQ